MNLLTLLGPLLSFALLTLVVMTLWRTRRRDSSEQSFFGLYRDWRKQEHTMGELLIGAGIGILVIITYPVWLLWNFWPLPVAWLAFTASQQGAWWSWTAGLLAGLACWLAWQCVLQFMLDDDDPDVLLFSVLRRERYYGYQAD